MKPYIKLRTAIMIAEKRQEELAAAIAVNPTTFSKKMTAKAAWTLWEAYKMCELLHIPESELTEYFPKEFSVPHESVAHQLANNENKQMKGVRK